ncbi:UDP-N-acetyl-D-mannosamine dehydrogenase [Candidatus Norongarragalina meridionalis]|nr:UDP-N-acetyl-D-mannosamine dehydrogenase [Candidatus Norongarragalina meridionalis]
MSGNLMKCCVVGLGYIGLPTACLLAASGADVVGIDVDAERVGKINAAEAPFREKGLDELLRRTVSAGKLRASSDFGECSAADAIIIAVPTPLRERRFDSSALVSACESVAKHMRAGALIIIESTVPPGTTKKTVRKILRQKKPLLAHCPERAIPGDTLREMAENDRVVGGINERSAKAAAALYGRFVRGKIYETDSATSEIVKLSENIYRDVNIALANELAGACEKLGADYFKVAELANRHPRVRLHDAGAGVGGHCIPLDSWFLNESYKKIPLLKQARKENDAMPRHAAEIALKAIGGKGRVALLGLAYKPDTEDLRETPAAGIAAALGSAGVEVIAFDPFVKKCAFAETAASLEGALDGADCAIIATAHSAFRGVDWRKAGARMRKKIIVDCRHVLENAPEGFVLRGIGRGDLEMARRHLTRRAEQVIK